ncbi:MAG: helix-turn-helix domain-containing protein [Rhodothermales bacterium]|nr:helix-turn-helix domain-containing protein [Rhodothermales bacterium]
MTPSLADHTDRLFHALSDRTRRDILRRTLSGEHSITTLAGAYVMSFAAVQKHVDVLVRAGLITKRRQGREAFASGNVETIRTAESLLRELEAIWQDRISRIDELLEEEAKNQQNPSPNP